ncbi:MAG: hypothetical protein WBA17_15460 [Saprospiraceae bacterium]
MKNLFLAILILLLFVGCAPPKQAAVLTEQSTTRSASDLERFVEEYNQNLGNDALPIQRAFTERGSLTGTISQPTGDYLELVIVFNPAPGSEGSRLQFTFSGEDIALQFPVTIPGARLTFLGNQLIIQEEAGDFQINLFVRMEEDTPNLTPEFPTIEGIGLGVAGR